jgi:hypothetical protein
MDDACIFGNIIEIFGQGKVTKIEIRGPSSPLKFHMTLAQSCKNTPTCLYKDPKISIAKKKK